MNQNEKEGLHLSGIEPPHVAPEATALSTELQVHVQVQQKQYNSFAKEEQAKNEKNLKNYEYVSFLLIFFYVFVIMYLCLWRCYAVC